MRDKVGVAYVVRLFSTRKAHGYPAMIQKVTAFQMKVKIYEEIFLWLVLLFWSIVFSLLRFGRQIIAPGN